MQLYLFFTKDINKSISKLNFTNAVNPSEIAEKIATRFVKKGYQLDFTLGSLENEIDLILKNDKPNIFKRRKRLEAALTAYFGETICRLYKAKWSGYYFDGSSKMGDNYYFCKIEKGNFEFYPSHFFGYYFENGSDKETPFKEYLNNGLLKRLRNTD
jgi:hypothetical protein